MMAVEDANVDAAVEGMMAAKFRNSGQTCVCANRIFVHSAVHDEFVQKAVERMRTFSVGHGLDPMSTHGPLIHERAAIKVEHHVQDALEKGARLAFGNGKRHGNAFNPTLLTNVSTDCIVSTEETFGPVAPIIPFHNEQDVLSMANDVTVGLAGYFYTTNLARAWRVSEALQVGMVGVNTGLISTDITPFGGIKQSGMGIEGSKYGIHEYSHTKFIAM
jgi:succinate-semialdehyde dehydrogenase/glutarate-semialdehyde dehydrogenase